MTETTLLDQTAPHVSAFTRNMAFNRLDAGLVNLAYINRILDAFNGPESEPDA